MRHGDGKINPSLYIWACVEMRERERATSVGVFSNPSPLATGADDVIRTHGDSECLNSPRNLKVTQRVESMPGHVRVLSIISGTTCLLCTRSPFAVAARLYPQARATSSRISCAHVRDNSGPRLRDAGSTVRPLGDALDVLSTLSHSNARAIRR